MNKLIKFRAWDKESAKMYSPYQIQFLKDNVSVRVIVKGDFVKLGNFELMHFTGLKDKNGKEIFEGDIVIGNTSYERDSDEAKWTKESPAIVEWKEEMCGFYPFVLNARWRCDVVNIEVIGNVFENEELLKGSK